MLQAIATAFAALLTLTQIHATQSNSTTTHPAQDSAQPVEVQGADSGETNSAPGRAPSKVQAGSLGSTKNVHQCGNLFFAGQFTPEDVPEIKREKIDRVINLRTDGEIEWNEQSVVQDAGLSYESVPFQSPDSLTDDVFDKVRQLLKDDSTKTLFHCGSANRVGGVWLPYRVLDEGVAVETAIAEAKKIGLKSPVIQEKALDYIRRKLAENPAPETTPNQEAE